MKLNLVDDDEKLLNKGDALIYFNKDLNCTQLIIVCPGCGQKSTSRGSHKFDKATNSYTPSIVHDKNFGGCGWHGWLTNGVFTSC